MVEIYFEETLDAKNIYEQLLKRKHALSINYITITFDGGNIVYLSIPKKKEKVIRDLLVPVITEFIIATKEDQWMLSLIEEVFYFTDFEEKNQILHIAHALIDGSYQDIPDLSELEPRKKLIAKSLHELTRDSISFSFESFLKFRLRNYTDQLLQYVELAIDEYKLEQEYQNFIQNLRDFLAARSPKFDSIHILHEEQFHFYNGSFLEMKRDEVMKYVDRKLIMNHPMYIDSTVLAPLVSIAPNSISIYTNEVDHGMIQTIQNIFLERVHIYSRKCFEQLKLQEKI